MAEKELKISFKTLTIKLLLYRIKILYFSVLYKRNISRKLSEESRKVKDECNQQLSRTIALGKIDGSAVGYRLCVKPMLFIFRLWLREEIKTLKKQLTTFIHVFVERASQYVRNCIKCLLHETVEKLDRHDFSSLSVQLPVLVYIKLIRKVSLNRNFSFRVLDRLNRTYLNPLRWIQIGANWDAQKLYS